MQTFRLISVAVVCLGGVVHGQAPVKLDAQSTGDVIMREADRVNQDFIGERVSFTMVLINAQGDRTERRFTLEMKENKQDGSQSRIEFESPENVRGTILLTHAHKAADDDQWLYLPSAKRVRRIAAASKSGAFMGSEFTYEDLTPFVLSKYSYTRLPDDTAEGKAVFKIERKPLGTGSGYSREVVWLSKETLMPVTIEYFDRKNDLLKVATYREGRTFGKHHRHDLLRMENRQTKRISELRAGARQLELTIDAHRFNSQALGQ